MPKPKRKSASKAAYVHLDTGEVSVAPLGTPEAEALASSSEHSRLTASEYNDILKADEPERKLGATGLAFARGVTGHLIDPVISAAGLSGAAKGLEEKHPTLSGIANIGGEIAGLASGVGMLGLAGKLGKRAGAAVRGAKRAVPVSAKQAGKLTGDVAMDPGWARRMAGAGTTGAIEMGAIGAGEAIGDISMSERPFSVLDAAGHIAEKTLTSAGFGLGFGAGVAGLTRVGEGVFGLAVRKRMTGAKELARAGEEVNAQIRGLRRKINYPQGAEHHREMVFRSAADLSEQKLSDRALKALIKDPKLAREMFPYEALAEAAKSAKRSVRVSSNWSKVMKMKIGKLQKERQKIYDQRSAMYDGTVADISTAMNKAGEHTARDMGWALMFGPAFHLPWFLRAGVPGIFAGVLGKFVNVGSDMMRKNKALREVLKKGIWRRTHSLEMLPMDKVYERFGRAITIPGTKIFTREQYEGIVEEIDGTDPDGAEIGMRTELSGEMPDSMTDDFVYGSFRALTYLKDNLPKPPAPSSDLIEPTANVSHEDLVKASRISRAVVSPLSTVSDYSKGEVTPEAARVWWELYTPQAMEFASLLESLAEVSKITDKKFSYKDQEQYALMTASDKMGGMFEPSMIKVMQDNFDKEDTKKALAQPQGGKGPQIADQALSLTQAIQERIG